MWWHLFDKYMMLKHWYIKINEYNKSKLHKIKIRGW